MERLNWHMADELSKYAEVRVIGPRGSKALKPENIRLSEAPLKPFPLFMLIAFIKAIWFALIDRPDIILAGSGLTAPLALIASKSIGAKSSAYLHGLDIIVSNKLYQVIWVPLLSRIDNIIVNSIPTKQLALEANIAERKISVVHPGVDLSIAAKSAESLQAFKQKYGLENRKILLSIGRLTTRKGLKEFVENSLPVIVKQEKSAILVIVGEAPTNSLGAEVQSRESIEHAAQANGVGDHIKILGRVNEEILTLILLSADVHIFPIRYIKGDPEGFGMVALEAAAHGLPTVAFATGGVIDAVGDEQSGYLVSSGDYLMLASKIIHIIQNDKLKWQSSSLNFAKNFAWPNFGMKIIASLQQSFGDKKR
ncbi:glycosyl transferase [Acinetobacter sp. SFB]|nr:glycosyl transferase [Acinetobacter sp. SFB]